MTRVANAVGLVVLVSLSTTACRAGPGAEGVDRIPKRRKPVLCKATPVPDRWESELLRFTDPQDHDSRGVTLGRSVEGRSIDGEVYGRGDEVILLIASIHGNERMGTPLLRLLGEHLDAHPELLRGRRVVMIPIANPDGFKRRSRHNANHVDINRNFPADSHKSKHRYGKSPLSEPEAAAIFDAIEMYPPDRIISIHQPFACVDYDGPGRDLAKAMAGAGKLKVKRLGSRPGSLGSYAGEELGIPVITLELPGGLGHLGDAKLWRRFGPTLLRAIDWSG